MSVDITGASMNWLSVYLSLRRFRNAFDLGWEVGQLDFQSTHLLHLETSQLITASRLKLAFLTGSNSFRIFRRSKRFYTMSALHHPGPIALISPSSAAKENEPPQFRVLALCGYTQNAYIMKKKVRRDSLSEMDTG